MKVCNNDRYGQDRRQRIQILNGGKIYIGLSLMCRSSETQRKLSQPLWRQLALKQIVVLALFMRFRRQVKIPPRNFGESDALLGTWWRLKHPTQKAVAYKKIFFQTHRADLKPFWQCNLTQMAHWMGATRCQSVNRKSPTKVLLSFRLQTCLLQF